MQEKSVKIQKFYHLHIHKLKMLLCVSEHCKTRSYLLEEYRISAEHLNLGNQIKDKRKAAECDKRVVITSRILPTRKWDARLVPLFIFLMY